MLSLNKLFLFISSFIKDFSFTTSYTFICLFFVHLILLLIHWRHFSINQNFFISLLKICLIHQCFLIYSFTLLLIDWLFQILIDDSFIHQETVFAYCLWLSMNKRWNSLDKKMYLCQMNKWTKILFNNKKIKKFDHWIDGHKK